MKKKIFTLLLSGALILGTTGGAMAAEKTSCSVNQLTSGKLQAVIQQCLTKYFDGEWGQTPETPESGDSQTGTQKPGQTEAPGQSVTQKPSQNGGSRASQVVSLVNQERQEAGLGSLKADSELTRLAQLKAEDMAEKGYFSHTSPTYGSAFDMMKSAGYSYRTAGENIAKGQKTAEAVMNGWMNSSGHRANILGSGYTKIGVGYATNGSGTPYWVQIFAG
ncbi:MAG: hypothetical protein IJ443_04740 [Firmicutes bacterium]|nr:hypothetical protein [Bacillota bacterium]